MRDNPPADVLVPRPERGLRAILDPDLAQYGLDVDLHRGLGDVPLARNQLVALPRGDAHLRHDEVVDLYD